MLQRERALRAVGRALVYPVMTVWRNRGLIRVMVRRDILGRYRGSFGGAFWTIINPLLLMLTYFFVFGVVLRATRHEHSRSGFALYFLAGMLPWLAFSEAVGRAPTVMLEHRNFVKKLVFAVETLPVNLVVAGLVTELFAVRSLLHLSGIRAAGIPPAVLWLPVLLIPAGAVHRRGELVPGGAGRVRARPGPDHRLRAHALVLPHAHLLSGNLAAANLLRWCCRRIRSTCWCAATARSSWRTRRRHSDRCGSCGWWPRSSSSSGHAWFYKLRKSFADMI